MTDGVAGDGGSGELFRMLTTRRRRVAIGVAVPAALLAALAATLAMPVRAWRTGEPPAPPLALAPPAPVPTGRVWVDTDAACGHSPRTDPDDCLALLLLATAPAVRLAGISTVAGNAPLPVVDSTTRALVTALAADGTTMPRVHAGGAAAAAALGRALDDGPLVIVALGPLTNVAAALAAAPARARRVTRVVAVMGRRRGHLFHPVEGGDAPSLLGHGPVFRDLNVALDVEAVERVVASRAPLSLVPYEAAREVVLGGDALDAMARRGGARAWVAPRARGWLGWWHAEVGIGGFYPFDLLAAARLTSPALLRCATVRVRVGRDAGPAGWLLRRRGLFIGDGGVPAEYCAEVAAGAEASLAAALAGH